MTHRISRRACLALAGAASASTLLRAHPAKAQSVEALYRSQPLRIVVGTSVGATYDAYARLIGRHIVRFLPGRPSVVVQNMTGAGGLTAANYLYRVAPKDGSTIGVFARGLPTQALLDETGVQFDSTRFNWLGSPTSEVSLVWAWHTTPFKTYEDLLQREMIIPATGPGADSIIFPFVMNGILGTKFKVISGYPGGPELLLAVERGEAEGIASTSWSNFASAKQEWVRDGKVRFLLQLGLKKQPEMGDVPLVLDKARTESDRKALELVFSRNTLAYPFVAPPEVPAERVEALRRAFVESVADPEFRADAKAQNLDVDPVNGEEMTRIIADVFASPPEVVARTRRALAEGQASLKAR